MTIDQWIVDAAKRSPDKCAIEFQGKILTYKDFAAKIADTTAELRARGIGHGDRVAWYGMNDPKVFVLLFACARRGAIFVPLNWRLADDEIAAIWASCAPSALFHDDAFAQKAAQLTCMAGSNQAESASADDALLIVYTSGSTGTPKGAVLTQKALVANAAMSIEAHGLTVDDTVLNVLPLFHVGGLNILPTPAFSIGASVVLHRSFDPAAMIADLARVQAAITVPTVLSAVLSHADWPRADLGALRCLSIGSTDVPMDLIHTVHARDVPMVQIYGATETSPFAIYQRHSDAMRSEGSIGRKGSCELRLVSPDGSDAKTGEPGEIWVRGDNVLRGDWRNPDLSAQHMEDGWFKTGDVASCDADGQYFFRDRIKHIIISGGENIYPAEIERVLRTHPAIAEVAVVGIPDAKWGETPAAVVVSEQAPAPADLLAHLKGSLARYKHPHHFVFIDELPRNAMGKVRTDKIRGLAIDAVAESANNGDAITEPG